VQETYYKVRWKGYPPSFDTWEPAQNLGGCPEILRAWIGGRGVPVEKYAYLVLPPPPPPPPPFLWANTKFCTTAPDQKKRRLSDSKSARGKKKKPTPPKSSVSLSDIRAGVEAPVISIEAVVKVCTCLPLSMTITLTTILPEGIYFQIPPAPEGERTHPPSCLESSRLQGIRAKTRRLKRANRWTCQQRWWHPLPTDRLYVHLEAASRRRRTRARRGICFWMRLSTASLRPPKLQVLGWPVRRVQAEAAVRVQQAWSRREGQPHGHLRVQQHMFMRPGVREQGRSERPTG